MSHSELLARTPMFEHLAEDDLAALARTLVERRFAAGEIIMEMGDRGTSMFIVADGHINIYLPGEASRRI